MKGFMFIMAAAHIVFDIVYLLNLLVYTINDNDLMTSIMGVGIVPLMVYNVWFFSIVYDVFVLGVIL